MASKLLQLKNDKQLRVNVLNYNTQQAKSYIYRYYYSTDFSVKTAYNRPSYYKIKIENGIINMMSSVGGKYYKIIGYNSSFFSCGYIVKDIDDVVWLIIETFANRYAVKCMMAKWNEES